MYDAPFSENPSPGNFIQLRLETYPYGNENRQYFGVAYILDSMLYDINQIPTTAPSNDLWGFFNKN